MYLDLAKQWKELAEHAARFGAVLDAVGLFRGRLVRSSPAARARNGAPFPGRFQDFDTTARISRRANGSYYQRALCERVEPPHLFVIRAQNLAGL